MTNSRSHCVAWTLLLATFALAIVTADPVLAKMDGTDDSEDSTGPHLTDARLLELALGADADGGVDVEDDDEVYDEQLGPQGPPPPPPQAPPRHATAGIIIPGNCGQVVRTTTAKECVKTAKFSGKCIPPPVWQYLGACQGNFGTKVDWSGAKCCVAEPEWCSASGYTILTPLPVSVSPEASTAIKTSLDMTGCNTYCARPLPYGGNKSCGPFKSSDITCCQEPTGLNCYPFAKKCT